MRLFVGGENGLVLFEDGDQTPLSREMVNCLLRLPTRLVVGCEGGKVLIWEGNGDAQIVAKDLGEGIHALALAAKGAVFAGSIPAGAWKSANGGGKWSELPGFLEAPGHDDWTAPSDTPVASAIGCHPKDAKTVYFGVEVGGVYRTRDAGKKWFDLGLPSADVHSLEVSPAKHDRVYVTTGEGSFCSDDEGFTWRTMGSKNPKQYTMGLAAHPTEPDRVIISAAAGPPPNWNGRSGVCDIYLSTDAGRRFRTVARDLEGAVRRKALVINRKVPSEVAFATTTGKMYYSNDGGESFDEVANNLGDVNAICFA